MKKKLLKSVVFFLASVSSSITFAQTVLFSETFESGTSGQFILNASDVGSTTSGSNDWIVNNSYTGGTGSFVCFGFPFTFTIPGTPTQPAGITSGPNSYYMHILSDAALASGITSSSFMAADGLCTFDEMNFSKMSADISTLGYSNVTFSFWWMCGGSVSNYGEVYYSIDGGTNWTKVTDAPSEYYGQVTWIQRTISLPSFDNKASLRFGFRFVNQTTSSASDPAYSIDDVKITGCTQSTSVISPQICQGENYISPSGNYTWNNAGSYLDTLLNAGGCDSIITVNLTVNNLPDVTTTLSGITITSNASGAASYQWIDCTNNNSIISGETNQTFTASAAGNYAVIVNTGTCVDTSSCVVIALTEINECSPFNIFKVYPNPASDLISIQMKDYQQQLIIGVYTILGELLSEHVFQNASAVQLNMSNYPQGMYLLKVTNKNSETAVQRIVKR